MTEVRDNVYLSVNLHELSQPNLASINFKLLLMHEKN
jgi:hypothetical protein